MLPQGERIETKGSFQQISGMIVCPHEKIYVDKNFLSVKIPNLKYIIDFHVKQDAITFDY
jgi:hypothetical protein